MEAGVFENPFYLRVKEEVGIEPGVLIACPVTEAQSGVDLTREVLVAHVLRPVDVDDSDETDRWFSCSGKTGLKRTVRMAEEESGMFIYTMEGWKEKVRRQIVSGLGERYFLGDSGEYGVVLINGLLEGDSALAVVGEIGEVMPSGRGYHVYLGWMDREFGPGTKAGRNLGKCIRDFEKGLSARVKGIDGNDETLLQELVSGAAGNLGGSTEVISGQVKRSDERRVREIVGTVLVGSVERVLMDKLLIPAYARENKELESASRIVAGKNLSDFGLREELAGIGLPVAISEANLVGDVLSPLGKLLAISRTVAAIQEAASEVGESVSSDDLVPMLGWVLAKAHLANLRSLSVYLEEFLFWLAEDGEAAFTVVTVSAALGFIAHSAGEFEI